MIYKPRHFELKELVCPHVYNRWGLMAWQFFDERLLMTIDFIRDHLGPMYVNNWDMDGEFDERGLRCVQCSLVKKAIEDGQVYCSAHLRGQAADFNIATLQSGQVRLWIQTNYSILPFPLRLEKATNGWTHIDVCNSGKEKVELIIVKR